MIKHVDLIKGTLPEIIEHFSFLKDRTDCVNIGDCFIQTSEYSLEQNLINQIKKINESLIGFAAIIYYEIIDVNLVGEIPEMHIELKCQYLYIESN